MKIALPLYNKVTDKKTTYYCHTSCITYNIHILLKVSIKILKGGGEGEGGEGRGRGFETLTLTPWVFLLESILNPPKSTNFVTHKMLVS